jgi:YVTN family beta-propeller protein
MGYITSAQDNTINTFDPAGTSVSSTFSTGGANTRFAMVNPSGTYLYVGVGGPIQISVYSTSDYTLKYSIPMGDPYGMAMNPSGTRLYVADGATTAIKVVDTTTNTVIRSISTTTSLAPVCIAYNPTTNLVYSGEVWGNGGIEVFNPDTGALVNFIHTSDTVQDVKYSSTQNRIYAAITADNKIQVINAQTYAIIANITTDAAPWAILINNNQTLAYVKCTGSGSGSIQVIDLSTNTITATISGTSDDNFAATYGMGVAMTSNTAGTQIYATSNYNATIISTATNTITGRITTNSRVTGVYNYKIATENAVQAPMQVTFNVNNAGIVYYSDLNVSVYDSYTGVLIDHDSTDSAGNAMFMLVPAKRYTVTVTGGDVDTVSQSIQIQASQNKYSIQVTPSGEWWNPFNWFNTNGSSTTGSPDQSRSITAKRTGALIGTTGYLDAIYNDTTGKTTSVNFTLYLLNSTTGNKDYIESQIVNSNDAEYNFTILNAVSKTYNVNITGSNPLYGTVYREGSWTFTPTYAYDMGWPQYFYLFFAIGISLTIGYLSSKRNTLAGGALLIVFLSMFWSIGWMSMLGLAMPVLLAVLTILLVVYAVAKWRIQNGV